MNRGMMIRNFVMALVLVLSSGMANEKASTLLYPSWYVGVGFAPWFNPGWDDTLSQSENTLGPGIWFGYQHPVQSWLSLRLGGIAKGGPTWYFASISDTSGGRTKQRISEKAGHSTELELSTCALIGAPNRATLDLGMAYGLGFHSVETLATPGFGTGSYTFVSPAHSLGFLFGFTLHYGAKRQYGVTGEYSLRNYFGSELPTAEFAFGLGWLWFIP